MSTQDEFDSLLSQLVEITASEPKVGDGIRHYTEDICVKGSASSHYRELRLTKEPEAAFEFLERLLIDTLQRFGLRDIPPLSSSPQ